MQVQTAEEIVTEQNPNTQAPAAGSDPRHADVEYWRSRFNGTAGRLQQEREAWKAKETEYLQQIADLKGKLVTKQPEQLNLEEFLTPEQIEMLGEEQARAIVQTHTRALAKQSELIRDAVQAEIAPLKQRQADQSERDEHEAQNDFEAKLSGLVPDFRKIDADPRWLAWLMEEDEQSGLGRQDILTTHVRARNALQVAKIFKAFKATLATPPVAPAATPGQGGDLPPMDTDTPQSYPSGKEIRDFYKRSTLGQVKDAERVAFERRLQTARS